MANYKILEEGFESKALIEWCIEGKKSYSIHTLDIENKPMIYVGYDSGKYFQDLKDAEEEFKKYSFKNHKAKKRVECILCEGTGILNGDDCPCCNGFGYKLV